MNLRFSHNPELSKHIGEFYVNGPWIWYQPELILKVMQEFLVIRAEFLFHSEMMHYRTYSYLFDGRAKEYWLEVKLSPMLELEKVIVYHEEPKPNKDAHYLFRRY